MKYQKKPVVVEAVKFMPNEENLKEVQDFLKDTHADYGIGISGNVEEIRIPNPHTTAIGSVVTVFEDDYIIKDTYGEFHSCKPDVFEKTYEPAKFRYKSNTISSLINPLV